MTFTKTRAWIAGTVVVGLLLAVAAWFLLISPKRAEAADTREQTVAAQAQNEQLREDIAELKADFAKLPRYEAELAAMRRALPEEDQLNLLIRDIEARSTATNVQLFSIKPATPVVYEGVAGGAGTVTPAAAAGNAAAAPAPGAAATPVAGGVLVQVPVEITVKGQFHNSEAFLRSLQQDVTRDYLVTGLEITPIEGDEPGFTAVNGDVQVVITGYVFAFTDAANAQTGAVTPAAAPAQGATPAAGTTPEPTSSATTAPAATAAASPAN